jgi:16S rRNA (cytosine1402-N4)-methyltransferase
MTEDISETAAPIPHKRRPRYTGKNPRRFEDKYKEHGNDAATIAKVMAAGKTPAGTHRPIMVKEILEVLAPQAGETAVDCTLGYGGHSEQILPLLLPGGHLIGLDADPMELPKAEARLRALGFGPEHFSTQRSNFAGLPQVLAKGGRAGVDIILADLGVSSMQFDDPARGFSVKLEGPLDMRLNPQRGQTAGSLLQKINADALSRMLVENADEPHAAVLGGALAGKAFSTTTELADAIRTAMGAREKGEVQLSIRRVFQALRIAVNDEFSALDSLLRSLPGCLNPGGRVVILTFHSGEDRRVKKAFAIGQQRGIYSEIAEEVTRPTIEERNSNPRSSSAKLRWARKAAAVAESTTVLDPL